MGKIILITLSFCLLISCAGYTGWYFGRIDGYSKAQELYSTNSFKSNKKSQMPIVIPDRNRKNAPTAKLTNTEMFKQRLIKMKKSSQKIERLNRENNTTRNKVTLAREKSIGCRWTVGRLGELKRIINLGGKGKDSQFCSEYKRRLNELNEENCKNQVRAFDSLC